MASIRGWSDEAARRQKRRKKQVISQAQVGEGTLDPGPPRKSVGRPARADEDEPVSPLAFFARSTAGGARGSGRRITGPPRVGEYTAVAVWGAPNSSSASISQS
jgi:hypothetical protein